MFRYHFQITVNMERREFETTEEAMAELRAMLASLHDQYESEGHCAHIKGELLSGGSFGGIKMGELAITHDGIMQDWSDTVAPKEAREDCEQ